MNTKKIYTAVIIILTISGNVFSQNPDSLTANGYGPDSVHNFAKNTIYGTIVKETGYGLFFGAGSALITGGLVYFGTGEEELVSLPIAYLGYSLGATYGVLAAAKEDGNNPSRWLTYTATTAGVVTYAALLLKQPDNFGKGKIFLINALLIPIVVPVLYIHLLDKWIFPNNCKEDRISKYKIGAIEYKKKIYLNIVIDL